MVNEFCYEIIEQIATISDEENDNYPIELNKISYNGKDAKLDLRRWNKSKEKMLRGLTLTDTEAERLFSALKNYFERS